MSSYTHHLTRVVYSLVYNTHNMTTYKSHSNPLYVRCAECHKDITLEAQYIWDCKVLCGDCNELDGSGELEISIDEYDSND